ncbi:peptidoglycan bridge formation glycyltransferase FemA/FemB family protein [Pontimicrobium aquaticum]|uniref:GNAT family N-acetyltransferase n=1 Tax=Pontimicrobium aquaticum TaxID=2565367 RepID=A0A4U0EP89_9FLAO|nr:peptidoglycan bridge formation glycyltransferase FemA/FemB family protein [Pontimicrobium aquaticum]TJY33436.1 GNAT family N-acetyltransferase [Pontimicrobium aquaticum]
MIKEITSKTEWQLVLSKTDTYDFYHTYDYHHISCDPSKETPILITYTYNDVLVALPLLLRKIDNTKFFDFTSIYGYGGPIVKNINASFDTIHFQNELTNYFIEKQIVSVFSRLHPYIKEQDAIMSSFGELTPLGKVVNIDVTLPIEDSRRAYQKSLKNQVNKLRRTCTVRKAETKEDIHEFIDIYYENMTRLNAKKEYFFERSYFFNFLGQTDFNTDILLVEEIESKKIIAGSMFVKTNGFVQFHLSGTRTDFLRLKPSKLFLDEMRIEASNNGYKYFNLGGGLGSKEDSLFEFKSSFSKDFRIFKVWKHIVNQKIYDNLSNGVNSKNIDYFPLYRAN